jgi:hypothetical protein
MEYNSEREHLILHEYGRNIQNMVKHAMTIEDRNERNSAAKAIVEVIGNLNPHLRDNPDYRHKLWDHLYIMSDFKLDVDSPYEKPEPETFSSPPEQLEYPVKARKFRHYGQLILKMIDTACHMEPGSEERLKAEIAIANHMKKTYLLWNKDHVDDDVIFKDLRELSGGRINLSDHSLISVSVVNNTMQPNGNNSNQGKRNKKYHKNYKKTKRYNKPNNR